MEREPIPGEDYCEGPERWLAYQEFLASQRWQQIRWGVLIRDKVCRLCGKQTEEVHHTRYDCGWDNPEYLIPLCHKCHRREHNSSVRLRVLETQMAIIRAQSEGGR